MELATKINEVLFGANIIFEVIYVEINDEY